MILTYVVFLNFISYFCIVIFLWIVCGRMKIIVTLQRENTLCVADRAYIESYILPDE